MSANVAVNKDRDHLRLLAIFYYVIAGLQVFSGLFMGIYIVLGAAMVGGAFDGDPNGPPPRELGWFFVCLGVFCMALIFTFGLIYFLTGRWLSQHRCYTFCFVIACISLMSVPWGTILGVFTIITLTKPSVKDLFAGIPDRPSPRDVLDDDEDDYDDRKTAPPRKREPDDGAIRE